MLFFSSVTPEEIKSRCLLPLPSQGMNYVPAESSTTVSPALWMLPAAPASPAAHTSYNNVMLFGR